MSYTPSFRLASLLIPSIFLAACGGSSSSDSPSNGLLSLDVTDAPVSGVNQVYVAFDGIDIKPQDGNWIKFDFNDVKQIELLALTGNASEPLLEGVSLPAGLYQEIRLHISTGTSLGATDDTYLITEDENLHDLTVPSGTSSGLKLKHDLVIAAGGHANFTIDFDLKRSLVLSNDEYKLKPVLRITNNLETGQISGSLQPEQLSHVNCEREESVPAVYLYEQGITPSDIRPEDNEVITAANLELNETTGAYDYEIGFIEAGDYTLGLTCDSDLDDVDIADNTDTEENVVFFDSADATVVVNETTEVNFSEVTVQPVEETLEP